MYRVYCDEPELAIGTARRMLAGNEPGELLRSSDLEAEIASNLSSIDVARFRDEPAGLPPARTPTAAHTRRFLSLLICRDD
jgi:hypothetical protein